MPRYEYRCPDNGLSLEVAHPMSDEVRTWGDLCQRAGHDPGTTPPEAPVEKVIGLPFLGAAKSGTGSAPGFNPGAGGCGPGCGCVPR